MSINHNTYVYVHAVWSTLDERPVLTGIIRKVLFVSVHKILVEKGIQVVAINGGADHIHCLVKLMPAQSLNTVITGCKRESENWLNDNKFLSEPFEWDPGYSAWSVSPSTIDKTIEYLNKQDIYHREKTLKEELTIFNRMVVSIG